MSSFSLNITTDFKAVNKMLYDMRTKEVRRAANRAINTTITTAKKESVPVLQKEFGATVGISIAGLRRSMKLSRSSVRTLTAAITVSGKPLPLINFNAKRAAGGVRHSAYGRKQLSRGAFIARMPTGHRGVFRRAAYGGKRVARLPIKQLYGPSLPSAFLDKRVQQVLKSVSARQWLKNFQRELNFYLSKV